MSTSITWFGLPSHAGLKVPQVIQFLIVGCWALALGVGITTLAISDENYRHMVCSLAFFIFQTNVLFYNNNGRLPPWSRAHHDGPRTLTVMTVPTRQEAKGQMMDNRGDGRWGVTGWVEGSKCGGGQRGEIARVAGWKEVQRLSAGPYTSISRMPTCAYAVNVCFMYLL